MSSSISNLNPNSIAALAARKEPFETEAEKESYSYLKAIIQRHLTQELQDSTTVYTCFGEHTSSSKEPKEMPVVLGMKSIKRLTDNIKSRGFLVELSTITYPDRNITSGGIQQQIQSPKTSRRGYSITTSFPKKGQSPKENSGYASDGWDPSFKVSTQNKAKSYAELTDAERNQRVDAIIEKKLKYVQKALTESPDVVTHNLSLPLACKSRTPQDYDREYPLDQRVQQLLQQNGFSVELCQPWNSSPTMKITNPILQKR